VLEMLICLAIIWLGEEMTRYYKRTGDGSLQGFFEDLKDRYYTKHEQPKREPQPGSEAHYQAWRAERMKEKNEGATSRKP